MRHGGIVTLATMSLALAGCEGDRKGILGLKGLFGTGDLALVDPLFGKREQHCLDRPDQLLAVLRQPADPKDNRYLYAGETDHPHRFDKCEAVVKQIYATLAPVNSGVRSPSLTVEMPSKGKKGKAVAGVPTDSPPVAPTPDEAVSSIQYDPQRRNEIIDAMIAVSNRKCAAYTAYIKNIDGMTNAGLSIAAIVTGGIGPIAGGEATAKALAATSAILSGSRAAINEAYLSNQTIHVLATAFQKVREKQRAEISNREACQIANYTVMRGLEDAWQYHESCSLVVGLAETASAVQRSGNPGITEMTDMLEQVAKLHKAIGDAAAGTTSTTDTSNSTGTVGATTGTSATGGSTETTTDKAKSKTTGADTTTPVATSDNPSKAYLKGELDKATDDLAKAKIALKAAQDTAAAKLAAAKKTKSNTNTSALVTADEAVTKDTADLAAAQKTFDLLTAIYKSTPDTVMSGSSEKATCPFT